MSDKGKSHSIAELVADYIRASIEDKPTAPAIAKSLNMSERTLHRSLTREGICYRELRKIVITELAKSYLSETSLSIQIISQKLGYEESASFSTAFKSWTGMEPSRWRARQAGCKHGKPIELL